MAVDLLRVLSLLGSGLTAGVLFAVAVSTLPALVAMEPGTYVYAHQLLGRYWDPLMPIIVLSTTATDALLAGLGPAGVRGWYVAAAAVLLGVSGISHLCNVPLNRQVKAIRDPGRLPADWMDPRPLWRRWHLLRTTLAVAALLVNAGAATVH
ncbi:putative membrane protein [Streptomyces sp. V3I8]|uniref:anthrone oxygenase family protein n=1 Tax=Streptomyces sp. V3I8 TaxID=3042279 RepID=UPI00277D1B13|nr:DUF1772 domain-containing protein [Streptomyces sp. V3I8]MDQ1041638.1 putative membrane protein [Streptomyces sp. V3I8]